MTTVVETNGLGKQYGRRWALRDCTLAIPTGRVVGLVGPNGAGKTTLLHLAVGLLAPTAGTITVFGGRPGDGPAQLGRVGFVAQDTPTYARLSVANHLRMGSWLNPSWDGELAERRIEQLGLDPHQRAQLALSLAIAKRPELLLLDEPVASLDPLARREFLRSLTHGDVVVQPSRRVNMNPFAVFDRRGIVPIGYAAFAFALGVAAGVLTRRTLPAMATALVALVGARLAMTSWGRPHLIAPLHITVRNTGIAANGPAPAPGAGALNPRDWVLSDQTINAAGHVIGQNGAVGNDGLTIGIGPHGVTIQGLGSCPNLTLSRSGPNNAAANALVQKCVDQLRIRDLLTYQPASRYWAFQWYETAIFLGAALILGGFCFWWVRRHLS